MGEEVSQNLSRVVLIFAVLLVMAASIAGCGDSSDVAVEDAAPDFSMVDATGDSVALADYTGTPVLLFFHMADG